MVETYININNISTIRIYYPSEYLSPPWYHKIHSKGDYKNKTITLLGFLIGSRSEVYDDDIFVPAICGATKSRSEFNDILLKHDKENHLYLKDNILYVKPHFTIKMVDDQEITCYRDTVEEIKRYLIFDLNIDIRKIVEVK